MKNNKLFAIVITALFTCFLAKAQYTAIPDAKFEQALITLGYDTGNIDGKVLTANIASITTLNISGKLISNLTGIQDFAALTSLFCHTNQLTTLDVSKNTSLKYLLCNTNQLTSLDVSKNTALVQLDCYQNQLTALDVSKNTALTYLNCYTNKLVSLNIKNGKNSKILTFDTSGNLNLRCILADSATPPNSGWKKDVTATYSDIDCSLYTAIPDVNFENALKSYDDILNDHQVPTFKIVKISTLDVSYITFSNLWIQDLTGIQDFVALKTLKCSSNKLTALDVSKNTALTDLQCGSNQLTTLDVSKNTALTSLDCSGNQLTALDVSKNTALTTFYCNGNKLVNLNIKNGNNIEITNFNCTNNPKLTCIPTDSATSGNASWNNWHKDATATYSAIDCSLYTVIPDVNFENALNALGYDDIPNDHQVPTFEIISRTSLDVQSKNISNLAGIQDFVALKTLWCSSNQLTTLDVTKNTALTDLGCSQNQFTSLDVTKNTALTHLRCFQNQLTTLDVTKNIALTDLSCSQNQLTTLDVTKNTALTDLNCSQNQLTTLNLNNNKGGLYELSCYSNNLNTLNLRNTGLGIVDCRYNPNLTCIEVNGVIYPPPPPSYYEGYPFYNWKKDAKANYSTVSCPVPVSYTYIPDVNFEQALIKLGLDSGATDGKVLTSKIANVTLLNVTSKSISDLTGIQDFVALTHLFCSYNQLTVLDVSKNTSLIMLDCSHNKLTTLDTTNNKGLIALNCSYNLLVNLNIKNGNNSNIGNGGDYTFDSRNNPNLTCIQCDSSIPPAGKSWYKDAIASYNTNCSLSTPDFEKNEITVILYPNPTNDLVNIIVPTDTELTKVEVYSQTGQKVETTMNSQVSLKHLARGEYLFVITTNSGRLTKKMIIN